LIGSIVWCFVDKGQASVDSLRDRSGLAELLEQDDRHAFQPDDWTMRQRGDPECVLHDLGRGVRSLP
jgi:hypothetical protein